MVPGAEVIPVAVADGGEGSAEIISEALGARKIETDTFDALMRPHRASYFLTPDSSTAILDIASASGLTHIEPHLRNPLLTSTYGTGLLVRSALQHGISKIILGVGGSATNDAGVGLLQALGYKFKTGSLTRHSGKCPVLLPPDFHSISGIDASEALLRPGDVEIEVVCDVESPLCGPQGASAVFAPQKGADEDMVYILENSLLHIAEIYGISQSVPRTGAAGGTSAGLFSVLGARLIHGADFILDTIGFDRLLTGASLVITGEGSADYQTLLGKIPASILRRGFREGIPVGLMAGRISDGKKLLDAGFCRIVDINSADVRLEIPGDALCNNVAIRRIEVSSKKMLSAE